MGRGADRSSEACQLIGWYERLASEIAYVRGPLRALRRTRAIGKKPDHTLRELIESLAQRFAERPALVSDRETITYRQLNARSNQYARWYAEEAEARGEIVALLMPNRPEYLCVWIGIAKAGGVTALLNTHLSGLSLAHCINVVNVTMLIVDASMLPVLEPIRALIARPVKLFVHGATAAPQTPLEPALARHSSANLAGAERVALGIDDKCIFIYTSGTTGLPKAANLNHYRVQLMMQAFAGVVAARPNDRLFDCLPMYHSNGGVVAPGAMLVVGGTCLIKERFSAREFWSDIRATGSTMFIYIGEMCRYLVNREPDPLDGEHGLRLCVGNGLRPDIWPQFQRRFKLPQIVEFYGSTEGNVSMFNFDSRPGAIGRIPAWAKRIFVIRLVKFDHERQAPIRDEAGFCIECAANEAGEAIGEILHDPGKPGNRFEGYADATESEKKILRNVFHPGDAWFRSGDLLRKDARGYFYFVDRIGDTFRWKGENVATSEVSEVVTGFAGVHEASVYGVLVAGRDGRAGMAALVLEEAGAFDLAAFDAYLVRHLPDYARPIFLRFRQALDVTGTFKQRKIDLVSAGFDPTRIEEPLFYRDPACGGFVTLDLAAYQAILDGTKPIGWGETPAAREFSLP
jgi:fatty-acyl-CoA synthase